MSTLGERHYSFEDGVKAGDLILGLIEKVDPDLREDCRTFLPAEQLAPLLERFREITKSRSPMPCVEGLISRLIKPAIFETSLMTLWGADDFWKNQEEYFPSCEIAQDLGFVQLGWWKGDCDGDAWIIDTALQRLACLSVDVCEFEADQVRLNCTLIFDSQWQWYSFLRCVAWERGWIPENK